MRSNAGHARGSNLYDYGELTRVNGNENSVQKANESKRGPEGSTMDDDEIATVRSRYMGIASTKVKKRRLNDRKFVFDWSTDTDTSDAKLEPSGPISVSFGRGHMGGFESKYNSRGSLDRHWSEKELIEMTERDWRIFREDFSISTKG
jgi:ATP-dependent RNA helicase DDX23/PRP28